MVSFGVKAKIKKAGNLNLCHSYVITTAVCVEILLLSWEMGTSSGVEVKSLDCTS